MKETTASANSGNDTLKNESSSSSGNETRKELISAVSGPEPIIVQMTGNSTQQHQQGKLGAADQREEQKPCESPNSIVAGREEEEDRAEDESPRDFQEAVDRELHADIARVAERFCTCVFFFW